MQVQAQRRPRLIFVGTLAGVRVRQTQKPEQPWNRAFEPIYRSSRRQQHTCKAEITQCLALLVSWGGGRLCVLSSALTPLVISLTLLKSPCRGLELLNSESTPNLVLTICKTIIKSGNNNTWGEADKIVLNEIHAALDNRIDAEIEKPLTSQLLARRSQFLSDCNSCVSKPCS